MTCSVLCVTICYCRTESDPNADNQQAGTWGLTEMSRLFRGCLRTETKRHKRGEKEKVKEEKQMKRERGTRKEMTG